MQFSHRTDMLAHRLGCRVLDLPPIIGVSERTLFAGRKDPDSVTNKTLLKLEAAERAAGLSPPAAQPLTASAPSTVLGHIDEVRDQVRHTLTQLSETQSRLHELESDLTALKSGLQDLLKKI